MNISTTMFILLASVAGLVGIVIGYLLRLLILLAKKGSMELTIKQKFLEARSEAAEIIKTAEEEAKKISDETKSQVREKELTLAKLEERLLAKDALLDKRQADLDRGVEEVKQKIEEIKIARGKIEEAALLAEKKLEQIAAMSSDEARAELLSTVEKKYNEDLLVRLQKLEAEGMARLETRAKEILATVIQRLANTTTSELTTTTVQIPSDDLKGKIIGKEGRNIRAFERSSGVEVIIDDTPGILVLSSFDPVRRATAKLAMDLLIKDGRIQPARIEEVVEKAKHEVERIMKEKAEATIVETGVFGLDPRVVTILGRLHFRTSYGQNVLEHSIEMSHLAGMIAEEIGADPAIARAGALLHDLGKAIDHEVAGSHVEIGRRILQKFGCDERIIKAMQSHHEEYEYETLESIIVQVADAISGSRPGARRDNVENYLKRLAELEAIANSFPGVEKSYAIAAGREIRIFVRPEEITDLEAKRMAQDIARQVEQELKYPGEIKVTIIRETRVIEYAR